MLFTTTQTTAATRTDCDKSPFGVEVCGSVGPRAVYMLPNMFHLSNTPVGTTSAHCANHFKRKWDKLADSITKRQPCDPTDASDAHNRCCRGPYPKHVADTRFDTDADANPRKPAFHIGERVLVVDCSSARDAWSVGFVTKHEIDFDELTDTKGFRYVGVAVCQDGRVSVFSTYADGLERVP